MVCFILDSFIEKFYIRRNHEMYMVNDLSESDSPMPDGEQDVSESEKKKYLDFLAANRFENIALSCRLSGGDFNLLTVYDWKAKDATFSADVDDILNKNAEINAAELVHNGINGLLSFHTMAVDPAVRLNAYKYALDRLDPRFKPKSEVAQNIKDERSKLTDEQLKAEIERLDAEIAALTAGTETNE